MAYEKLNWQNVPEGSEPPVGAPSINAQTLNHMDEGIYNAHESVTNLNTEMLSQIAQVTEFVNGKIVFGSYIGDGAKTRVINLETKPKAVIVYSLLNGMIEYSGTTYYHGGIALDGHPAQSASSSIPPYIKVMNNGFQVSYDTSNRYHKNNTNNSSEEYVYIAFM